jgi:hypothetical protein
MRPHKFTSTQEYNTSLALRRQYVADAKSKEAPSFAVTGIIRPAELDVSKIALYVKRQGQATRAAVASYDFPLSAEDVQRVYHAGLPSQHGKGSETVDDPTYRQAHEIKVSQPFQPRSSCRSSSSVPSIPSCADTGISKLTRICSHPTLRSRPT